MAPRIPTTQQPVLFIDSGLGGLPYLQQARRHLPNEHFIYIADRANFPYGHQSPEALPKLLTSLIVRAIARFNPKMIVLACNTASVVSLEHLRNRFSLPFVGVVPAVKLASRLSPEGRIGVLVTEGTASTHYLRQLIEQFVSHNRWQTIIASGLVEMIEHGIPRNVDLRQSPETQQVAQLLRRSAVDVVILGCTHFIFARQALASLLPQSVHIVDSLAGVTTQIVRLLTNDRPSQSPPSSTSALLLADDRSPAHFYLNGPPEIAARYARYIQQFNIELKNFGNDCFD